MVPGPTTSPDALGSVRQAADGVDAVTAAREWTPYDVEVSGAQASLDYTGKWWNAAVGLQYLRARWYAIQTVLLSMRKFRQTSGLFTTQLAFPS